MPQFRPEERGAKAGVPLPLTWLPPAPARSRGFAGALPRARPRGPNGNRASTLPRPRTHTPGDTLRGPAKKKPGAPATGAPATGAPPRKQQPSLDGRNSVQLASAGAASWSPGEGPPGARGRRAAPWRPEDGATAPRARPRGGRPDAFAAPAARSPLPPRARAAGFQPHLQAPGTLTQLLPGEDRPTAIPVCH